MIIHDCKLLLCLFITVFCGAVVFDVLPASGATQSQSIVVNTSQTYGGPKYTCVAGKYLPANSTQCAGCPGTTKYCPGGEFQKSESDQGIFNCPTNTVTNTVGDACIARLSQDIMRYGAGGKNKKIEEQCWTQREIRPYAECVTKHIQERVSKPVVKVSATEALEQVEQEKPAVK